VAGVGEEQDAMSWYSRRVGMKVRTAVMCLSVTALIWLSLAASGGDKLSRTGHADDAAAYSSASGMQQLSTVLSIHRSLNIIY